MDEADAAAAAVRQAKAEGLTMQRSDNATGYRGVRKDLRKKSKLNPFFATVWRNRKTNTLGYFATAEEAALAYARAPEARAQVTAEVANPKPVQLTAKAAVVNAEVVEIDEEDEEEKEEDEAMGRTDAADAADSDDSDDDSDDDPDNDKPATKPAAAAAEELEQEEDPPASSPAAAKRAGPPPKLSPAKQPHNTQPLRPVQPVPLPQRDGPAPQASPPAAAAAAVVPAEHRAQQLAQLEARLGVSMQPGATPVQHVEHMEALLEVTAAGGLPTRVGALVAAADAQGW